MSPPAFSVTQPLLAVSAQAGVPVPLFAGGDPEGSGQATRATALRRGQDAHATAGGASENAGAVIDALQHARAHCPIPSIASF